MPGLDGVSSSGPPDTLPLLDDSPCAPVSSPVGAGGGHCACLRPAGRQALRLRMLTKREKDSGPVRRAGGGCWKESLSPGGRPLPLSISFPGCKELGRPRGAGPRSGCQGWVPRAPRHAAGLREDIYLSHKHRNGILFPPLRSRVTCPLWLFT